MNNKILWIGTGIVFLMLISKKSSAATANNTGSLNLNDLADQYGSTAVNKLNAIYQELLTRGYTNEQILWMLSQILFESGLFTDVAKRGLMNKNNYAGLTTTSGGYASYNSISDFVDAYDGFLTKNNDPLGASSLSDFNTRLQQNHYYTEDPNIYYNGLLTYYNLLANTIQ